MSLGGDVDTEERKVMVRNHLKKTTSMVGDVDCKLFTLFRLLRRTHIEKTVLKGEFGRCSALIQD